MENKKILVVDDDEDIIRAIKVILEKENYNVITSDNKSDGLDKIKTEKPDLAILDVMMENMSDGFDMANEIKAENKNIKIILYTAIDIKTGVSFKSAFGKTNQMPVDGYIEKTATPDEIVKEVKRII